MTPDWWKPLANEENPVEWTLNKKKIQETWKTHNMTKKLVKTVEKLFQLHIVNDIHPSKGDILKNDAIYYSETTQ